MSRPTNSKFAHYTDLLDGKDHHLSGQEISALRDIANGIPPKGRSVDIHYFYARYGTSATNRFLSQLGDNRETRPLPPSEHKHAPVYNTQFNTAHPPLDVLARNAENSLRHKDTNRNHVLRRNWAQDKRVDVHGSISYRQALSYGGVFMVDGVFVAKNRIPTKLGGGIRGDMDSGQKLERAREFKTAVGSDIHGFPHNWATAANHADRVRKNLGVSPRAPSVLSIRVG